MSTSIVGLEGTEFIVLGWEHMIGLEDMVSLGLESSGCTGTEVRRVISKTKSEEL